jgi:AcrR family transcriptional regulator
MKSSAHTWIAAGYETFAVAGVGALKVEVLAKQVGISKSSFYHHFADLEIFVAHLLDHHLQQSQVIADKEKAAQLIDPELIQVLVAHRLDLLFNRQLRFHQEQRFQETLQRSNAIVGTEFIRIWKNDLQLTLTTAQLHGLFELALENFYLQIHPDHLNEEWLTAYFKNLRRIALRFV